MATTKVTAAVTTTVAHVPRLIAWGRGHGRPGINSMAKLYSS
jgi:hypothetical protein